MRVLATLLVALVALVLLPIEPGSTGLLAVACLLVSVPRRRLEPIAECERHAPPLRCC